MQTQHRLALVCVDLRTGKVHNCGENRGDTPPGMILDWVALESRTGDLVFLNGRLQFMKLPPVPYLN